MIYVSEDQLKQVEYLVDNSRRGIHFLFTQDEIRESFSERFSTPMKPAALEKHLERWIAQPTLAEKRFYLDTLDPFTFAQMVRAYFSMVSNRQVEQVQEDEGILQ